MVKPLYQPLLRKLDLARSLVERIDTLACNQTMSKVDESAQVPLLASESETMTARSVPHEVIPNEVASGEVLHLQLFDMVRLLTSSLFH